MLSLLLATLLTQATMSPTSDLSTNRVRATGASVTRTLRDHLRTLPDVSWDAVTASSVLVKARGTTQARGEDERWAECVNILDFTGADPTGVGDSTAALKAAMEKALGIAAGTLDTGYDTYADVYDTTKRRVPVCVPAGRYRLTSAIRVAYANVQIRCDAGAGGGSTAGGVCAFIKDHDGDAFSVDASVGNPYNFQLSGITIRPATSPVNRTGTGAGVKVTGGNWLSGLHLDKCSIRELHDGVLNTQTAGTIDQMRVRDSVINGNAGWGIYSTPLLTNSEISGGAITQNATGGVIVGGFQSRIANVDLEGQPVPLAIQGTNGSGIQVENPYFELDTATSTYPGQITFGLSHQGEVRGVFNSGGRPWSSGTYAVGTLKDNLGRRYRVTIQGGGASTVAPTGEGSDIQPGDGYHWASTGYVPAQVACSSTNGLIVKGASVFPNGCSNLTADLRELPVHRPPGSVEYATESINASHAAASRLDRRTVSDLGATTSAWANSTMTEMAGRRIIATYVTGGTASILAPAVTFTLAPGETIVAEIAIKIAGADLTQLEIGALDPQGYDGTTWTSLTDGPVGGYLQSNLSDAARAGDTFFLSVAVRNNTATTFTQVRTYVYVPHEVGQSTWVSRVIYRKRSSTLPTTWQPLNVAEALWQDETQTNAAAYWDNGNTSVTLYANSPRLQRFDTTLTADRTITLPAAGMAYGDKFRIVRTGLGAFTLTVQTAAPATLKVLPSATAAWCDVEYVHAGEGDGWRLTAYGAL